MNWFKCLEIDWIGGGGGVSLCIKRSYLAFLNTLREEEKGKRAFVCSWLCFWRNLNYCLKNFELISECLADWASSLLGLCCKWAVLNFFSITHNANNSDWYWHSTGLFMYSGIASFKITEKTVSKHITPAFCSSPFVTVRTVVTAVENSSSKTTRTTWRNSSHKHVWT